MNTRRFYAFLACLWFVLYGLCGSSLAQGTGDKASLQGITNFAVSLPGVGLDNKNDTEDAAILRQVFASKLGAAGIGYRIILPDHPTRAQPTPVLRMIWWTMHDNASQRDYFYFALEVRQYVTVPRTAASVVATTYVTGPTFGVVTTGPREVFTHDVGHQLDDFVRDWQAANAPRPTRTGSPQSGF